MGDDEEYQSSFEQSDDGALMAAIAQREAACAPLLKPMGGNPTQALQLALADPPYATRTESVKVASYEVVAKCMHALKDSEIAAAVGALSIDECGVLMKYLYRGMGTPNGDSAKYSSLLKWHPIVLKKAGQGSIVRVISEVKETL